MTRIVQIYADSFYFCCKNPFVAKIKKLSIRENPPNQRHPCSIHYGSYRLGILCKFHTIG